MSPKILRMGKIIEAKNINKSFGTLQILKNINLTINSGEIVSIVGPSGAGKTTLLQILGTLERPSFKSDTTLKILGEDILSFSDKKICQLRNRQIGFIFQFHELLPEFTAIENVCLPAMIAKTSQKKAKEKAAFLLEKMKVYHRKDHKPNALSGGEQQRVAVARALINDPKVIFADEPSGNLDTKNAEELHELFFELNDTFNHTFIIVTHNDSLASSTNRKIILKDGQIQS